MSDQPRVIVVTPSELADLVQTAVKTALRDAGSSTADEWLGPDELARMLNVERSTIPLLVRREGLPCYRPGRAYTFRRPEILSWLEERASRPRSHAGRHGATLRAVLGGREGR